MTILGYHKLSIVAREGCTLLKGSFTGDFTLFNVLYHWADLEEVVV